MASFQVHVLGSLPLLAWVYLLSSRGGFWRVGSLCAPSPVPAARRVIVLIPARDEADLVGTAISSLLQQTFNGFLHVIVIDDGSRDGTAEAAAAAAGDAGATGRVTVVRGAPLPPGWTGKLWALAQGVEAAAKLRPDFLLFTDADIVHHRRSVAALVADAEAHRRELVSHMVRLSTVTGAERLLMPAYVFFFFMLYPPRWVAAANSRCAAAAGGCILIRPQALARIGGLHSIRSSIIDDCALARRVKASGGAISLQLSRETRSVRSYSSSAAICGLVSRTAFAQLGHSYLVLVGTLLALFFVYLLPPALIVTGDPGLAALGAASLLLMSLCYLPMVRFHDLRPPWCLGLPLITLFYIAALIHSTVQYSRGRGGSWKGRVQDGVE